MTQSQDSSAEILSRFLQFRPPLHDTNATVQSAYPAYMELLEKLGSPHKNLPPVFHVAGTNGKGSTCAFLRAILEAAGYRVHVYTSPHLVSFHERIRVSGELIEEPVLADILQECAAKADLANVSYFEASTAAAFTAFARHPADFVILETGLGGRMDATNVVDKPLATLITRLSYDHCVFLGNRLDSIAREKAGIMRRDVPCFVYPQPDAESIHALRDVARKIGTPIYMGGDDWRVRSDLDGGFTYSDNNQNISLPAPALLGAHQYWNAGLAIAALTTSLQISSQAIATGIQSAEWPARLQKLDSQCVPKGWELWLDGGHNDSAGEVLATQAKAWRGQDNLPLHLIVGMIDTKNPAEFLRPLVPHIAGLCGIAIPDESKSLSAVRIAEAAHDIKIHTVTMAEDIGKAVQQVTENRKSGRILICGSLYLAGHVLQKFAC